MTQIVSAPASLPETKTEVDVVSMPKDLPVMNGVGDISPTLDENQLSKEKERTKMSFLLN